MRTFLMITFIVVLGALFLLEESNKPEHELAYKILCAVMLWLITFIGVFMR